MITTENFDSAYEESMERMTAYRETQVTALQKLDVEHQIRHVQKNRSHWLWNIGQGAEVKLCVNCGAIHASNYVKGVKAQMDESGLCFGCNYWSQIAKDNDPRAIIVNGQIYVDGGNKPGADSNTTSLGFAGHLWHIKKGDCTRWTNNLWNGSVIPQEHRAALPDNAEFLKR